MVLPSYFSHYMMTLNELKLFDVIETLKKQQGIVLGIFEKQQDAVLVLERDKTNLEQPASVVYSNNAFKEIVKTDNERLGVSKEILKIKQEDQDVDNEDPQCFSIMNLIEQRPDFVANQVFELAAEDPAQEHEQSHLEVDVSVYENLDGSRQQGELKP